MRITGGADCFDFFYYSSPSGSSAGWAVSLRFASVGVGVGIGIDPDSAILARRFMNCITASSGFRQHGHYPIKKSFRFIVFLSGHRAANLQHILHRAAFQRRTTGNLEVSSSISGRRFAVAFG